MAIAEESVRVIFSKLAGPAPEDFFNHVADDVQWTVLGSHPLAGLYTSKEQFHRASFARLKPLFDNGLKLFTRNVLVDGSEAAVELCTRATAKSGMQFNNDYCWICSFEGEQIVKVRAYLDSALVSELIDRA